jgi:PAS domain-containing protein
MNIFNHFVTWQGLTAILTGIVSVSTILEKVFKFHFIWNWLKKTIKVIVDFFKAPLTIVSEVKEMKLQLAINFEKLQVVENEVKYNGGKFTLKLAVKEIREIVDLLVANDHLSHETLRASMYVANDPIYITNAKGEIIFFNASFSKWLECTDPNSLLGKAWLDNIIPKKDRAMMREMSNEFTMNPYPFSGIVSYCNMRTGDDMRAYVRSTIVKDIKGNLVEVIGTLETLN